MYNDLLLDAGGGIISKSSKSPQMGSACVMIGVGGTGLAALRRVKKEVYKHLEPDDPYAAVPKYSKIAFLGIDTDTNDLTVQNPDITELQSNEQQSVNIPQLGAMLNSAETRTDPCLQWLSPNITLKGDKGAGGVRQAGRFCLFKYAGDLRSRLAALVRQTMTAAEKAEVQVHIFAGISGGTGSGCFLDVCYILRDVLQGINSTVCGYFFLPDTQLYREGIQGNKGIEDYNKRNGYAALRDLDYCMSIPSSGGCFVENYAPGFHVESREAPVDLCHLVSVTDTNGVTKADGFSYSMSVIAEYVLTYLSDVNATNAEKSNDTKGLTIEGFTINVNTALGTLKPRVGAERNYNIVGASCAELPLTHIGTYLASVTYSKMKPSLGRHSSKLICDEFAHRVGVSMKGLISALAAGVSTAIPFNPDPEKPASLNEDLQNWEKVPGMLWGPIVACKNAAIGKIQENFDAQCRDLESYDARRNAAVQNPTVVLMVFNELIKFCKNAQCGPTMAADLLHADGIHDLRAVLRGVVSEIDAQEQSFRANVSLRQQDIMNAAHRYNRAAVGWKKRLQEYQDAWTEYIKLEINLELCAKLKNLIPFLEKYFDTMYRSYFAPLKEMVKELGDTFDANITWLNSPIHTANESYCWRIFEYDDVKQDLENTVLSKQNMDIEHQDFMDYIIDHFTEWNTRQGYRTAHCINTYMVERFKHELDKTVDDYLMTAYQLADPNLLPSKVRTEILNAVSQKASPLFWKSPVFQLDDTTTVSNNVMSIPMGSTAIANAAASFAANATNVIIRPSALGDRISCLRFVSGIPLFAYNGITGLNGPYNASTDPGLHLHERDVNWREVLPSPIPYSVAAKQRAVITNDARRAELYDRAVAERVICPRSPAYPNEYVVRIIPSTERLVADYQKKRYFPAGSLDQSALENAITQLKIERSKLLPETVADEEGLVLLNDGYTDPNHPEMDASEIVRRDYLVRFIHLAEVAEKSLAELQRIDDKLAEMESWKAAEKQEQQKIHRYLMLDEMGYFAWESSVKVQLRFTYRGVPQRLQLCDVNSVYRYAPEYQVYCGLDEIDPQQLAELDQELKDKYLKPLASWRAPLEKIISTVTDAYIEDRYNDYINDVSRDALAAFYRSLRTAAAQELRIVPDPTPAPAPVSSPDPVPDLSPVKGWKCPNCDTMNAADDSCCVECGEPRPSESWTCKNGHIVPWANKFCGKCGRAGGKRPDLNAKWKCPNCGTMNAADDSCCVECGEPK